MSNLIQTVNEEIIIMTSLEVVDLINNFRKEEGNEILKKHDDMLKSIRNEIEMLKNAGIKGVGNFSESYYINSQNKKQPCYKMNKAGIMQMLNKESALVRYKTQQYIEKLEYKLDKSKYNYFENLSKEMKAILMHDRKIEVVEEKVNTVDKKFDELPLFPNELKLLKRIVNKKAVPLLGGKKAPAYKSMSRKVFSDIYKQVHREFGVAGCEEIKRKDFDLAKEVVEKYELPRVLEVDISSINGQLSFV